MKKSLFFTLLFLITVTSTIFSQEKSLLSIKEAESQFTTIKNSIPNLTLKNLPQENNGRLSFRNNDHFLNIYNQLISVEDNENIKGDRSIYYLDPDKLNTLDPEGVLIAFENNFDQYKSLRSKIVLEDSKDLFRGVDPTNLKKPEYTDDEVMNSLFNEDYEVEIGNQIVFAYGDVFFKVPNDRVLTNVKNSRPGKGNDVVNPWTFSDEIEIIREQRKKKGGDDDDEEEDCTANASFISNGNNYNHSFTFTGTPNPNGTTLNVEFHWTFGDGSTSSDRNPSHTFSEKGEYNVCLYVEAFDVEKNIFCNDSYCTTIVVERPVGDCEWFEILKATFIPNETGVVGEICFTATGNLFAQIYDQDLVVTYLWNFGDGSQSTEQFPCHTFTCDKDYNVTLVITTESGCRHEFTIPVIINSYKCCNRKAGTSGETEFGGKYKIKWEQKSRSVWPYWISGKYKWEIKERHYKKRWGIWWRKKANLKVEIEGSLYGETSTGCLCEDEHDISGTQTTNSWKCEYKRTRHGRLLTKRHLEWTGKYFVSGNLKNEEVSEVVCE